MPVWEGRICTSSINERIRKIPRPEVFNRFSGANGSGILAGIRTFTLITDSDHQIMAVGFELEFNLFLGS